MKNTVFIFIVILFLGCHQKSEAIYFESQSKLISQYRAQGFFEYSSRLNDSMISFLKKDENQLVRQVTYETIIKVSNQLKKEKPTLGCYQIDWDAKPFDSINKILLEWHSTDGIIIRFFTLSEEIMTKLPQQSF